MADGLARSGRPRPDPGLTPLSVPESASREQLEELLTHAYDTIGWMLANLREGKDQIEQTAVRKLHVTDEKLHAVSSTTETAATDMLDGLDRALLLLERIESDELSGKSCSVTGELRDEIYGVMNHLQFQDITTQQLSHASSILHEMEAHLSEFVQIFDAPADADAGGEEAQRTRKLAIAVNFDPAATLEKATDRQALVDQLLGSRS